MSVLKVVATIETPTSHQGAARPEVKNSVVLELARAQKKIAGRNEMTIEARDDGPVERREVHGGRWPSLAFRNFALNLGGAAA